VSRFDSDRRLCQKPHRYAVLRCLQAVRRAVDIRRKPPCGMRHFPAEFPAEGRRQRVPRPGAHLAVWPLSGLGSSVLGRIRRDLRARACDRRIRRRSRVAGSRAVRPVDPPQSHHLRDRRDGGVRRLYLPRTACGHAAGRLDDPGHAGGRHRNAYCAAVGRDDLSLAVRISKGLATIPADRRAATRASCSLATMATRRSGPRPGTTRVDSPCALVGQPARQAVLR